MLDKIKGIENRYSELNDQLMEVGDDYKRASELSKERSDLEPLVKKAEKYKLSLSRLDEAKTMASDDDAEIAELAKMEIEELEPLIKKLESEIKGMLLPKDKRDGKNVIVEIRAGAGGDEAGIFGSDLYRMYTMFAEHQGWKTEIMSLSETGVGGIKEVTFKIDGKGAFSRLKFESGVHRVQRVPATESQGRIHTSTATVAVLAEVDEVEINIPDRDIKMDVYKSAGAGGQSVQKNSTAVRITHLPTGIVIQCQDERSQLQNRLRAMSILRARLFEMEEQKQADEVAKERRSQVGSGDRSEKIRTYNYPQSRITDHRISFTTHNLPAIMDGDINTILDELATHHEAERLAAAGFDD
jgi:peptide chain release factor 1